MESEERDPESEQRDPLRDVDLTLRRALEPNPLAVERLVRKALAEEAPARRPWWPRLAVAAAVVLLAVLLIPDDPEPPALPEPPPEPVRISISNADGNVTISSPAGSQWILISGDDS